MFYFVENVVEKNGGQALIRIISLKPPCIAYKLSECRKTLLVTIHVNGWFYADRNTSIVCMISASVL